MYVLYFPVRAIKHANGKVFLKTKDMFFNYKKYVAPPRDNILTILVLFPTKFLVIFAV